MKITLKAKTVDDRIFQVFTFVLEDKKKMIALFSNQ